MAPGRLRTTTRRLTLPTPAPRTQVNSNVASEAAVRARLVGCTERDCYTPTRENLRPGGCMASAENVPVSSPPAPVRAMPVAPVWHTVAFVIFLLGFAVLQTLPAVQARAAVAPSRIPTYIVTIC